MRRLDEEVKSFVVKLAGVAAEEARLLREVVESRVWHWLGMTSVVAYVEARFGIGPHAAAERLRVAPALAELPMVEAAFESGAISYGHARARVVTAATEQEWLGRMAGMTARHVQQAVAGHVRGNRPDDNKRPSWCGHACGSSSRRSSKRGCDRRVRPSM